MNNAALLTIKQVADRLQVHVNTVYNYIYRGELKAIKLSDGSRWRIREQDLERYLEGRQDGA